ncbi:MAG: hypothetical protein PHR11_01615, partial [Candidatus Omnitrophica bacterium]|nr:hypothetical protein [Candidatus Omnitrophota bacterium]
EKIIYLFKIIAIQKNQGKRMPVTPASFQFSCRDFIKIFPVRQSGQMIDMCLLPYPHQSPFQFNAEHNKREEERPRKSIPVGEKRRGILITRVQISPQPGKGADNTNGSAQAPAATP